MILARFLQRSETAPISRVESHISDRSSHDSLFSHRPQCTFFTPPPPPKKNIKNKIKNCLTIVSNVFWGLQKSQEKSPCHVRKLGISTQRTIDPWSAIPTTIWERFSPPLSIYGILSKLTHWTNQALLNSKLSLTVFIDFMYLFPVRINHLALPHLK